MGTDTILNVALISSYALLLIAVFAAVAFPFYRMTRARKGFKPVLFISAILIGLFFISFLLSKDNTTPQWLALGVTPGVTRLVGSGLIKLYFTIIKAVLALVYSYIKKALK